MSVSDPSPIDYKPLSDIKEVSEESQFKTFKQQVELNGKRLTVTLYYPKTSTIDPTLAKNHMEAQIAKMLEVAKAAGMGKEEPGLRKLTFEKDQGKQRVFGEYQQIDKSTVRKNVLEHLKEKKADKGIAENEKEEITKQIKTIKKTIKQLSLALPATLEPPSGSSSTPSTDTETTVSRSSTPPPLGHEDDDDEEKIDFSGLNRGDPVAYTKGSFPLVDEEEDEDLDWLEFQQQESKRASSLEGKVEVGPSVKGKEKETRTEADFDFEDIPISSLGSLREVDSAGSSRRVEANVTLDKSVEEAKSLQKKLEKNRLGALKQVLDKYSQSLQILKDATSKIDIQETRANIAEASSIIKEVRDKKNEEVFKKLKSALANVNREYNEVVDQRKELEAKKGDPKEIEKLKAQEKQYLEKVQNLNQAVGNLSLTTSQLARVRGQAMAYMAVVEKKMDLLERKFELEEKPSLGPWQKYQLSKINKELAKAPSDEILKAFKRKLLTQMDVALSSSPYSVSEAKEENQYPKELEFGRSHLNSALATPANWTNIYSAFSKLSRSGRLYTSATVNESLKIGKEGGGVPAGLRNKKGYRERPANLFKTTSYLLEDNPDSPIGRTVSFRGGQFPTKKAAKEALTIMLDEDPKATNIHINALLTPMITLPVGGKPDRRLLAEHKANITAALEEMIQESDDEIIEDPGDLGAKDRLEKVKEQLVFTNFGVNEGAVGELKILMRRMRLGWHTSIGLYTNEGAQKFNAHLRQKFNAIEKKNDFDESDLQFLANLSAIVQVGQEMEAIWARNDYADAKMGHNQFKLPALWKAMDALTGTICYTDCMSGKDRTGEVESAAKHYLDEAHMNMNDRKLELQKLHKAYTNEITREEEENLWIQHEADFTNPMLTTKELNDLFNTFKSDPNELTNKYKEILKSKVNDAKQALGLVEETGVLLKDKGEFSQAARIFGQNTIGIPETVPLRDTNKHAFPDVTSESIYEKQVNPGLRPALPKDVRDRLAEKQREAINRRISILSGSLPITQVNTSLPGFKIKGGEPLSRFSSGFDRDYVYSQLLMGLEANDPKEKLNAEKNAERFAKQTGLNELSEAEANEFTSQIKNIHNGTQPNLEKLAAFLEVIKAVEEAKTATFSPKAKVKA